MRETRRERLDHADEVRKRQKRVLSIPVVVKRASDIAVPASQGIRLNAVQDELRKESFLTFLKGIAKFGRRKGFYETQGQALEDLANRLDFEHYNDLLSFLDSEGYERYPWDKAVALKKHLFEGDKGGNNRRGSH